MDLQELQMTEQGGAVLVEEAAGGGDEVYLLPASLAQRRLWFLHQLDPSSHAYHVSGRFLLRGSLSQGALRQSLEEVVRRHEILRTTFLLQDDEPVQVVATAARPSLPCFDLSGLSSAERDSALNSLFESVASRPFNLERGPLLRCALFRLTAQEHAFVYVMHHIVTDGWSEAIFVRELATLYNDFSAGLPPSLPELPIQYGDFAQWQRDTLQGEVLDTLLAYWRKQLDGVSGVLELPTDHPRPAVFNYRGAAFGVTLPEDLTADLRRFREDQGVTLFPVALAAFSVLLSRCTGQTDLLIGSPVANRNLPELEELIGLFLNTLVLRLDLSGNPTSGDLVAQAREVVLGALEHQDLLYERLLLDLRLDRDPSRNPLFQVALAVQNNPEARAQAGGLEIVPLPATSGSAKFDLQITIQESGDHLYAAFEYATDLFEEATVRRLADSFLLLLAGIVRQSQERIGDLPLLDETGRQELISLAGAAVAGPAFCLHEKFREQAARTPEAVAVTCNGEALTYAALDDRSDRLARYLQDLGVGPEVRVGIYMERSLDLVVAILGTLKAGGAYLPVDASYPRERIAYMLDDAGVAVLLTRSAAASLPDHQARTVLLDADGSGIAQATGSPAPGVLPDNAAYVVYTSGSTGHPKGVVIPHGNVARLFGASAPSFQFAASDVWTLFHSHAFDFSVWEIWGALLHGGRLVVVPYLVSRSPELFAELLEKEGVTVLNQTPSAFRNLLLAVAPSGEPRLDSLRWIIFGGEALDHQSLAPWWRLHGQTHPVLVNMYGITETTVHVTHRVVTPADLGTASPIGRPLPHLELHLLDASLSPAPFGVRGEILVGGEALARGYLDRPALTAERFVPDPFSGRPGARLYRSGDLAVRRSHGEVEYVGRIDYQVKIRGFRVELGEIEAALLRHPAVQDGVVVLRQDRPGEPRIVAYPVLRTGLAQPEHGELRAWLERELPAPMIPAAFLFLESLPLTAHGKIDPRALPAPGEERPDLEQGYVAPQTPVEEVLTAAWAAALGVDRVGVHDSFFALGGDSIRTIKAVGLIREKGFAISVPDVFLHPTPAELANVIGSAYGTVETIHTQPFSLLSLEDRARLPHTVEDAYPLSGLQGGMLFHMQQDPESIAFHNLNSHYLRLTFDPAMFQAAITHIAARHPVLRTSFDLTSYSKPLQLVHREPQLFLTLSDLRHLPDAEQQDRIATFWREQLALPFDLTIAPQVRFHVHWRADDQFQFSLIENHSILDGWSLHIIYSEILTCYFSLLQGEGMPTLPLLTTTFRDFIYLEREAMRSEEAREFWQRKLDSCRPLRAPRLLGNQSPFEGRRVSRLDLELSNSVTDRLRRLASEEAAPIKSVLLAAHVRVMALLGGQGDVLTSLSSNGRPETVDGSHVCGLFLNTLPFRMTLMGGTWRDLVREVYREELEIMPHRRFPLARIQEDWGQGLLLESSFAYLNFHVMKDVVRSNFVESLGPGLFIEETDFPIMTTFQENYSSDALVFSLECDRSVLVDAQITALQNYYVRALEKMTDDPEGRYDVFSVLTAEEEHCLLVEWNDTSRSTSAFLIYEVFEAQAKRTPDLAAVVFEETVLTYSDLSQQVRRLAWRLVRSGVTPGTRLALCVERGAEMVAGLLAILAAGGVYVPLDVSLPAERLRLLVEDADAQLVLTSQALSEKLSSWGRDLVLLDVQPETSMTEAEVGPQTAVSTDDLAYVIYTSGSTGKPKGVAVGHRQLANYLSSIIEILDPAPGASYALVSTPAADLGHTMIFGALCTGGCLLVVSEERAKDPVALAEFFLCYPPDGLKIVPSHLMTLMDCSEAEKLMPRRWLVLGGEALDWSAVERVRHLASGCRIFNEYGPTEATVAVLVEEIGEGNAGIEGSAVPVGRPMTNSRVYVLGTDLWPVPPGVPAELFIGGANLAQGYLGEPMLTAHRFIPDPFGGEAGARLYRTGDMVRILGDGRIEFLDRIDNQVKIRGFRVELGEIESVLRAHVSVRDVVVGVRDEGGGKSIVAYVIPEGETTESVLRGLLGEKLPSYMMPSAFVFLEKLPLTPNGKIDRRALPAPQSRARDSRRRFTGPMNELEVQLLHIWEETLGLDQISVTDDFFALGANSLQAVRLVALIRKQFGQRILLSTLIEHRTIRDLAGLLRKEISAPEFLVPIQPQGKNLPLYFAHPGHGNVICYLELARYLGREQPFYGLQSLDLDYDEDPYISIEEMAARYLGYVREVQPHGPYLLGGWSFGGLVAFEMAQQLLREGESVPRLFMLDTSVPVITESLSRIQPELMRAYLMIDHAQGAILAADQEPLSLTPYDIVQLTMDEQLDLLLGELERRQAFPDLDREVLRRYFHMRMARIEAMNKYVPQPYDGRIVLLRTSVLNTEIPLLEIQHIYQNALLQHPSYGWSDIAREVEVEPVPGHHESMIREPNVRALAAALRKHIDGYSREMTSS